MPAASLPRRRRCYAADAARCGCGWSRRARTRGKSAFTSEDFPTPECPTKTLVPPRLRPKCVCVIQVRALALFAFRALVFLFSRGPAFWSQVLTLLN